MGYTEMALVTKHADPSVRGRDLWTLKEMANMTTADGYCFASLRSIGESMRCHENTVRKSIKRLVTSGELVECCWDDLPRTLPKPPANYRPTLYRLQSVQASPQSPRATHGWTPRAADPGVQKPSPGVQNSSPGVHTGGPNRDPERESEREGDVRMRNGPDTDTDTAVPVSRIAERIRYALQGRTNGAVNGE